MQWNPGPKSLHESLVTSACVDNRLGSNRVALIHLPHVVYYRKMSPVERHLSDIVRHVPQQRLVFLVGLDELDEILCASIHQFGIYDVEGEVHFIVVHCGKRSL